MSADAVAVLMGGWSEERAVSLQSGACVLAALRARGVDAQAVDLRAPADLSGELLDGYARFFIALHGTGGEDGAVQGALERAGRAYTGSGSRASRLCMDKGATKRRWRERGVPTPPWREWRPGAAAPAFDAAGVAVKPLAQGSSIGVSLVRAADGLSAALARARAHAADGGVLIERLVAGEEYTVGVLDGAALPMVGVRCATGFYDYRAKYEANDTEYRVPCGLPRPVEAELRALSLRAFEATGACGYGRVDLLVDELDRPWFLEVNTIPGMRRESLLPRAAAAAGIAYEELALRMLATARRRPPEAQA